jgi:predicted kinase
MPRSPEAKPLRCHLLIGPPASGKSTLATVLADLVGGRVVSTDGLRAELFGDAAIQGPWAEVENLYHWRIREAVADGVPVILDATHARRPYRLAITQALPLPDVQWIGWWLTTPLDQCLAWNQMRERHVPPQEIRRLHQSLPDASYVPDQTFLNKLNRDSPSTRDEKVAKQARVFHDKLKRSFREEGLSYVSMFNPAEIPDLRTYCHGVFADIDRSIQAAQNRRQDLVLHRYSRLLDLERLLFLMRLLLEFPGLEFYDHSKAPPAELREELTQLRQSFRFQPETPLPLPEQATFAVRAAFALARRHGACYGNPEAVEADLEWLRDQGFASAFTVTREVDPGPPSRYAHTAWAAGSGFPPAAHRAIFQRQLGLVRYIIQNPFDAPDDSTALDPDLRLDGRRLTWDHSDETTDAVGQRTTTRRRPQRQSSSLRAHLLARLQMIDGIDYRSHRTARRGEASATSVSSVTEQEGQKEQLSTLDKDIELLITGYGFRNLLTSESTSQQPS